MFRVTSTSDPLVAAEAKKKFNKTPSLKRCIRHIASRISIKQEVDILVFMLANTTLELSVGPSLNQTLRFYF